MSKLLPWRIYFLLLALPLAGRAGDLIPISDFTRSPEVTDLQVSPDGKTLGFIGDLKGVPTLYFRDLATGKIAEIDPKDYARYGPYGANNGIISFEWVTKDRVIFTAGNRLSLDASDGLEIKITHPISAVNRDGTNWRGVAGDSREKVSSMYGELGHVFEDESGSIYLFRFDTSNAFATKPDVVKVDTLTGNFQTVVRNFNDVDTWYMDHQDRVRLGLIWLGNRWQFIYRADQNSPWENLSDFDSAGRGYYPMGFGYDDHTLYVAAKAHPAGMWGLYKYNLTTRTLGPALLEDPNYDILNPYFGPVCGLIFSRTKRRLIGVHYVTDWPQTVWLDPEMASYQAAIDRALPRTINWITSMSDDETELVVLAYNGHDPGTYYLFSPKQGQLNKIAVSCPLLDPEKLAQVYAIKYTARDGLLIHGYLTLPHGAGQKNLPLVVYPHGGPFMRDILGYDPMVQFLASRGYAVLQVNYRGSTGYGEAFYQAGQKEVGRAIQDDITDGVKAMIAGGFVNPKRIAILGEDYGGYSALWALENTPGLYRCGISIGGVTDWEKLIGDKHKVLRLGEHNWSTDQLYLFWKQRVGNPGKDRAVLEAISPLYHVERIKAPVLLVQGEADREVPKDQAERMVVALKAHHVPYEAWIIPGEGHDSFSIEDNTELYKRIEAFLAKNMN